MQHDIVPEMYITVYSVGAACRHRVSCIKKNTPVTATGYQCTCHDLLERHP